MTTTTRAGKKTSSYYSCITWQFLFIEAGEMNETKKNREEDIIENLDNKKKQLAMHGIAVYADIVLNHKGGADEKERIRVMRVDPENRNKFTSEPFDIDAWTKFTFPGRKGMYYGFIWDFWCFSGVDYAADINETGIFSIINDKGKDGQYHEIFLDNCENIEQLLLARNAYPFSTQRDYFDHGNCIGWTREGLDENEGSGCAVLLTNSGEGFKSMEMGKKFAGKTFVDLLKKHPGEIIINTEGWGRYHVSPGSVSVYVEKK